MNGMMINFLFILPQTHFQPMMNHSESKCYKILHTQNLCNATKHVRKCQLLECIFSTCQCVVQCWCALSVYFLVQNMSFLRELAAR